MVMAPLGSLAQVRSVSEHIESFWKLKQVSAQEGYDFLQDFLWTENELLQYSNTEPIPQRFFPPLALKSNSDLQ